MNTPQCELSIEPIFMHWYNTGLLCQNWKLNPSRQTAKHSGFCVSSDHHQG